ncbi:MAG: hypothetical protein K2W82_12535 [Candidatus Obscuribacterales bacterium]|nr:hypothetical protein [Candidatus Obscuribacterales bacterium]
MVATLRKPTSNEKDAKPKGLPPLSFWQKIAPYLFWQIAAVLFVEFALFCAGLGEEEIFKLDPILGSRHMTNKRVTWRSEGFAQSYFNAEGLRENEALLAKPPGTYRIALLGDSLTESLQVPLEASFGRLLQNKLSEQNNRPVQILNFGTSGYSTAQEYLQLRQQVLKYKPDLVLVCYNSRDIFENWSPGDQVLTNVRPFALHLPGSHLVVDSAPVRLWMRSPRAKILQSCEWFREHSRLWGFLSAIELDLSLHNQTYRFVVSFLTKPGKAIRELTAEIKNNCTNMYKEWSAKFTPPQVPAVAVSAPTPAPTPVVQAAPAQPVVDTQKIYKELVMRTLGSLFVEMEKECAKADAQIAVVALPVRSALCPTPGMELAFNNYNYEQEVEMLNSICSDKKITLINCQQEAEKLSLQEREKLFYSIHYSPYGQTFVSQCLSKPLQGYLKANK